MYRVTLIFETDENVLTGNNPTVEKLLDTALAQSYQLCGCTSLLPKHPNGTLKTVDLAPDKTDATMLLTIKVEKRKEIWERVI